MIRFNIQQPALPKYRIPIFRQLAQRPNIQLTVYHGQSENLPNAEPDGFQAHYVPQRRLGPFPYFWHGIQWTLVSPRRSDVVWLLWDLHYLSLWPALVRARLQGVPVFLHGHGYSKHENPIRRFLRNLAGRLATAVVVYNHTAAQHLIQDGFPPQRVFVALNALDQDPIQQTRQHWLARPADLETFRRRHNLTLGQTVLFVSRLDPANRLDLLFHAATKLLPEFPHLKLVIIGKGEPEGSRLRCLAADLRLEPYVLFAGAIYEEMQLAPWFLCSDVFCYPANIGLSILHAFGYGLPVITSNAIQTHGPEIEALRHDHNGLLYEHDNPDDLARQLACLLRDPGLRRRLAQHAHRTATEQFTLQNMINGLEAAVRYCHQKYHTLSSKNSEHTT